MEEKGSMELTQTVNCTEIPVRDAFMNDAARSTQLVKRGVQFRN